MAPLISVIVPCWNVEKYLKECIISILSQGLKPEEYEIICIDDGSTDSTGKMLDSMAKELTNMKVIHKENGGLSSARNEGLRHATGEYVSFVDSDDCLHPAFYKRLLYYAKKSNADVTLSEVAFMYDYEQPKIRTVLKFEEHKVSTETIDKFRWAGLPVYNYAPTKFFKRSSLIKSGVSFEEGVFFEDIEWAHKVMYLMGTVATAPDAIYYYRQHAGQIVQSKSLKWLKDRDIAQVKATRFVQSLPTNVGNMREYDWTEMKTYKLFGKTLMYIRTCGFYKLYYLFGKFLVFEIHHKVKDFS